VTSLPSEGGSGLENFVKTNLDPSVNWEDITWLKTQTKLPILLKGLVSPEDAFTAVEYGVHGIIVSNHGGRQLDTHPATIDCLPGVVDAVNNRIPVYVDGGIRRGTDVLKALAFGAKGVFIGRPVLWSLYYGVNGVDRMLKLLQNELVQSMKLCGVRNLNEIDRRLIFNPKL